MKVALIDAFGGLAGDMLLGALVDLATRTGGSGDGPDTGFLAPLDSLGLPDWKLTVTPTRRRSLGALAVDFRVPHEHAHRHLPEILARIEGSGLGARAKRLAMATFTRLAEAEARVHRIPVDQVHFHEVGAADAILDICGVALAVEHLGIDELRSGPLPAGSGTVRCDHGEMPCPVPAVVELLGAFELRAGEGEGEMVTPTGAALLATLGRPLGRGDAGLRYRPLAAGYGAGTREQSVLRVTLAEVDEAASDEVLMLETNLDDASPEQLAWAMERLFDVGALDVSYAPLVMKKGRPGVALRIMAPIELRAIVLETLFAETPTLGVREQRVTRTVLEREIVQVQTPRGKARVKVAGGQGHPEYEDCARIAREHGVPLREIYEEVLLAWRGA